MTNGVRHRPRHGVVINDKHECGWIDVLESSGKITTWPPGQMEKIDEEKND